MEYCPVCNSSHLASANCPCSHIIAYSDDEEWEWQAWETLSAEALYRFEASLPDEENGEEAMSDR